MLRPVPRRPSEQTSAAWLWRRISEDGRHAFCPRCAATRRFAPQRGDIRYVCRTCGLALDPRAGTAFEASRTPLGTWFVATAMLREDPELTPTELAAAAGVSYATSWRMLRRLRELPPNAFELRAGAGEEPDRESPAGTAPPGDLVSDPRLASILRAAATAIVARGFADTRISDIAREAGVSPATVLHHFRTREGVLLAALRWAGAVATTQLTEELDPDASARDWLRESIRSILPADEQQRAEAVLQLECWNVAVHEPELVVHTEEIARRWRETLAELVQHGADRGEFATGLPAADVADMLAAALNGLWPKVLLGFEDYPRERCIALADALLDTLLPATSGTTDAVTVR